MGKQPESGRNIAVYQPTALQIHRGDFAGYLRPVPAEEILDLGSLAAFMPGEDSEFAKWLFSAVEALRRLPVRNMSEEGPLTYHEYLEAISSREKIASALYRERSGKDVFIYGDSNALRYFILKLYRPEEHTRDLRGYADYLGKLNIDIFNAMATRLGQLTPQIRLKDHRLNAYIVGARNSGKSELLKQLLHHYVKHPELGGVLFLDPHGKASQEVAKWREFGGAGAKRLMYLDAKAKRHMNGLTPALNPIRRGDVDDDDLMDLAVQIAESFSYTVREADPFTPNMRRLLEIGIYVLLRNGGGTLADLQESFIRKDGGKLAKLGRQDERRTIRQHYESLFFEAGYQSTKEALARRIEDILLNPTCERMLTLPGEIDLLGALEEGKIILVNCAAAGEQKAALGRLLMSQVSALGNRRLRDKVFNAPRIHIFADEATLLLSRPILKIMQELRKVGISLTLAQQNFGQGMDAEMLESVLNGTELKMFGVSETLGSTFKRMGWKEKIPPLKQGDFMVAVGSGPRQARAVLATHDTLVDDANSMTEEEWETVLEGQFEAYYRRENTPLHDNTGDNWEKRTWKR